MPSGLVALLDDISVIAKAASASIDDIGVAAGKAGSKTAGVVIDDAAVTPSYVHRPFPGARAADHLENHQGQFEEQAADPAARRAAAVRISARRNHLAADAGRCLSQL